MRIAALDVGDARIGVAVSDELGISARGIGTVRRRGGRHDLDALARLLGPHEPERIVVGLPLDMDGGEGRQATRVRAFGARVAQALGVEVEYWDERLTTFEAQEALRRAAVPARRRRALVDRAAAAIILRSYLDGRR